MEREGAYGGLDEFERVRRFLGQSGLRRGVIDLHILALITL